MDFWLASFMRLACLRAVRRQAHRTCFGRSRIVPIVPVEIRSKSCSASAQPGSLDSRRSKPKNLLTIITDSELFPDRMGA